MQVEWRVMRSVMAGFGILMSIHTHRRLLTK